MRTGCQHIERLAIIVPMASPARYLILGTAGHIDHGKSSLVTALTGTDPDRLPEEQRRGMTIELGFAELDLGDVRFGVVDVPGHEKFVRTMVAGATGIDVALIVVAADDSVMPQTVEHVEILALLGVHRAVVALSKCDLVDAELRQIVAEDIRELLARTPMRDAPIVPVSSITGEGIAELKEALRRLARDVPERRRGGPFRVAIDRVFTVQGRGTVVTGSVLAGSVLSGDTLELHPVGLTCRVRDVQSHGRTADRLLAGQRAALNLIGVERTIVERGFELATPGYLTPTRMVDVHVTLLKDLGARVKRSVERVRVGLGTAEQIAKLVVLSGASDTREFFAQLRFAAPLTAVYGQRFILRDENATHTIGGGAVLRPVARKRSRVRLAAAASRSVGSRSETAPTDDVRGLETLRSGGDVERVEEAWRFAGFEALKPLQMAARAGVSPDDVPQFIDELATRGRVVLLTAGGASASAAGTTDGRVTRAAWEEILGRASSQLVKFHAAHPDEPGCPVNSLIGWIDRKAGAGIGKLAFERMTADGRIKVLGRYAALPEHAPALSAADEKCLAMMLDEYRQAGFKPPALAELRATRQTNLQRVTRMAKIAVAARELAQIDAELYLHADAERALRDTVDRLIAENRPVTVAELREALDSSRKYAVPFLEYLDRVGFTRRVGDVRVRAT